MNDYSTIIGMDLGDTYCNWALMTRDSEEIQEEGRVATTKRALQRKFEGLPPARVVMEVGSHSPWISRLVGACGHEVIVANPRKLKMLYANERKCDKVDARMLARIARADWQLLYPVQHRSEAVQADLAVLRARDALVGARTKLINAARGLAKSLGQRLPKCSTPCFHRKAAAGLPEALAPALRGLLSSVGELSGSISAYDAEIERMCREDYPETALLRDISGVGPLTALLFVLTIESPERFPRNRDVGAYLGLTRRYSQSGEKNPELGITKTGDPFLRRTLVQAAHYIIGKKNTQDSELRQWGLSLAGPVGPDGKHAKGLKKRAAAAVARKLAVLLNSLWRNGECYDPFQQRSQRENRSHAA